ncbi:MAG: glycosyltransferase family 2 protein [Candidatus Omnitrophota bacterium]
MKLIVQIPCLNEEQSLPLTVKDIPRQIKGIDKIELLVIDDGSTDRTVEVAKEIGVDHILRLKNQRGLARAFAAGIDASLRLGADIIVNTDADNQYNGQDIAKLIKPILEGDADFVVGARDIDSNPDFSLIKKKLQRIGSWAVRQFSETDVPDATSGFRAYSREMALNINIVSPYTYTLETIIQAGKKHMAIVSVPIRTNKKLRESRLFSSILKYIERSATTIIRMYTMYQPLRVFFYIGGALFGLGVLLGLRFIYFYIVTGRQAGHIQSLILSAVFLIIGFQMFMLGLIGDLISSNRRLIEDTLYRVRKIELQSKEK